jgi:hypothetical protein
MQIRAQKPSAKQHRVITGKVIAEKQNDAARQFSQAGSIAIALQPHLHDISLPHDPLMQPQ